MVSAGLGIGERTDEALLVGRKTARSVLLAALDAADSGRAAAVAVEGDAGAGKTMLMEWIIGAAVRRQMRVVAARPVEGEADLPLAVILDVVRPLAKYVGSLSPVHRKVLTAASGGGGGGGGSADRLILAVATLTLLAAAAEDRPLLLVVDDAQWVDAASARALSFAVRRLLADRVAVVIARRPSGTETVHGPWTRVSLPGLTADEVADLIRAESGVRPAAAVISRILHETQGNPLAVSTLAGHLPAATLSGEAPMPMNLPLGEVALRTFAGLVRQLPPKTQSALTVIAAAGSAASHLVSDALSRLGVAVEDVVAAEAAGLVEVASGRMEFRHPLHRAAAFEVAGAAEIRQAHAALAATAKGLDLQRHAWHRGLAVLGTDEGAAQILEEAAASSETHAGAAATVGLRTLAVAVSPLGGARNRRELDAVRALVAVGHHAEARDWLRDLLDRDGVAPEIRADAIYHHARLMLWDTPLDTQPVAVDVPDGLPPRQMSATLAVAALRARNSAELERYGDLARAGHAHLAPLAAGLDDLDETLLLLPTLSLVAESDLVRGWHTSAVVREITDRVGRLLAAARGGEPDASRVRRGLAAMFDDLAGSPVQTLAWTARLDLATDLLKLWLSAAHARPANLAYLLMARTELCGWTGELLAGVSAADRAIELSCEVGSHVLTGWTHVFASRLYAAIGDEAACLEHGRAAAELGNRLNEPGPAMWAVHSHAYLLLSTGRPDEAANVLEPIAAYAQSIEFRGIRAIPWQPDHIECLARAGRTGEAADLLETWTSGLPSDFDDWHRAIVARCRCLVQDEEPDELVGLIDAGVLKLTPIEEARCCLVAGGALRRRRRAAASRLMLRRAADTFARHGAIGWRATAEAELNDRSRVPVAAAGALGLTSQEMRVAHEIAGGATNKEAAARLFCSQKTIEYHLTRVYAKLGVRSRSALAGRLATPLVPARPG